MENPWNPFSDYVMNYKARPRCAAILMLVSPQQDMTRAVVARNRPFWKTSNSPNVRRIQHQRPTEEKCQNLIILGKLQYFTDLN